MIRYGILLTLVLIGTDSQARLPERNYLQLALREDILDSIVSNIDTWRAERRRELFEKAGSLPEMVKQQIIDKAEEASNYRWPSLAAWDFLQYKLRGERVSFQEALIERRKMIRFLVMGEMVSRKGKYLQHLINAVWATCEESTWSLPAHMYEQEKGIDLPSPNEHVIDLFAGEASAMLSLIYFLFGAEFDRVSPIVNDRIEFELNRRLLKPFLDGREYGWMALSGERVNNWNIWINNNILTTAVYALENKSDFKRLLAKSAKSTDQFINGYGEDGGIDEGPTYWEHAAARLVNYLCTLQSISGNKVLLNDKQLIRNMGSYIYKAYIDSLYFVNPADATAKMTTLNPASVYRFGDYFNDSELRGFAAWYFHVKAATVFDDILFLSSAIELLDSYAGIQGTNPSLPREPDFWLPDIQMLVSREKPGSAEGLHLFVQGGNNNESHNHNDVGNFTIYADGKPVIIDVGAGTYSRSTFGQDRYANWNMQSQWHNCPSINGVMQSAGSDFKASGIRYKRTDKKVFLSMNIAAAYPAEAMVNFWKRSWIFSKEKSEIRLLEEYSLSKRNSTTVSYMVTTHRPRYSRAGEILLINNATNTGIGINFSEAEFDFSFEEKRLEDQRLLKAWAQPVVYRLLFKQKSPRLHQKTSFVFRYIDLAAKRERSGWINRKMGSQYRFRNKRINTDV